MLEFVYKLHFPTGDTKEIKACLIQTGPTSVKIELSGAYTFTTVVDAADGISALCAAICGLREYFLRRANQGIIIMMNDKVPPLDDLVQDCWTID